MDKPMNIWILNHYATPPTLPGGTRHFDFAEELTKQGHHVSIFASAFMHKTRKDERLKSKGQYRKEVIDGVEFCWIRTSPYYGGNDRRRVVNMLSYGLRVAVVGVRFRPRPDVILASSPHPFAGLAGYALAKVRRARFVFEVRDLWPQTLVDIGGYSPRSVVVRTLGVLERFLYQRADKIVVLLPKASAYITPLGIPGGRIVYIPNGADPRPVCDRTVELPGDLSELVSQLRSQGKVLVAYVGAHGIVNALDTIVKAANLLQKRGAGKIHFLLVGDGTEKPRLQREAGDLGLDNISFFTSIPKNAIPSLLMNIDIALITERDSPLYVYGTSPNKLWDYMQCAKPIVRASGLTDNPVAEARCGLSVPPEEPRKLADAIVQICNMTEKERQETGMRGREYVMKYHSTPVLAARLLEVLQEARNE